MNAKTPKHISEQLKDNLQKINSEENDDILKVEKAVGICSVTLLKLREFVNRPDFKNKDEEIRFLKK